MEAGDGERNLVQVTQNLEAVGRRVGFETSCPFSAAGRSRRQGHRNGAAGLGRSLNRRVTLDS